ncbi:hypothetical protein [Metabacillus sp. cB07]|uniref:hypothetical protein n=1 Tax=Metabacillus sp. cB07 TaxID=2806989 RepID=UPI00193953C3|nr:hypothetical protein [Metabacillus sp. cB07]
MKEAGCQLGGSWKFSSKHTFPASNRPAFSNKRGILASIPLYPASNGLAEIHDPRFKALHAQEPLPHSKKSAPA